LNVRDGERFAEGREDEENIGFGDCGFRFVLALGVGGL